MSLKERLRGITENIFQIGKGGPQVKRNVAALEIKDAADAAFAILRGLDPVGINDFVTLNYFNNNNAAAINLSVVRMPLLLATKVSTVAIPNNSLVFGSLLDIETAYDTGTLWAVTRTGDGTKILQTNTDNDPEVVNTYSVRSPVMWGSTGPGTVTATLSGATPVAGAATLYIFYSTPPDIS